MTDRPQSLIEILRERPDTGFDGKPVRDDLSIWPYEPHEFILDNWGNHFTQPHDHLSVVEDDGHYVGIFVADEDGRHCFDHELTHLPHGIGLFVREEYRGQGIATDLIHDFMNSVEHDTCVIDCEDQLMPFYEQLECEVIYADPLKHEVDVDRYHDLLRNPDDREHSNSSETRVLCSSDYGVVSSHHVECNHVGKPGVAIQCNETDPLCEIVVQFPYFTDGNKTQHVCLTEDAIQRINTVLDTYRDCATIYHLKHSKSDYITFPKMLPDDARRLADEIYPIITSKENLVLKRPTLDFKISEIDSLKQKAKKASHCVDCKQRITDVDPEIPLCKYCRG